MAYRRPAWLEEHITTGLSITVVTSAAIRSKQNREIPPHHKTSYSATSIFNTWSTLADSWQYRKNKKGRLFYSQNINGILLESKTLVSSVRGPSQNKNNFNNVAKGTHRRGKTSTLHISIGVFNTQLMPVIRNFYTKTADVLPPCFCSSDYGVQTITATGYLRAHWRPVACTDRSGTISNSAISSTNGSTSQVQLQAQCIMAACHQR